MFLSYLTLVTALAISGVAIYYSVAGLAAIFAAAVIPIIIMGGTLEVAKLVTAVWLHRYWHQATWWLKTYLTTAVLVLMFITSMGIFGFLSNAHVQQTAQGDSAVAEIERIDSEIARQNAVISRAEDKIENVQNQGVGGDSNIQTQIDREQERIDRAYQRAEPLIKEQRAIIQRQEGRILDQIEDADSEIERVDAAIARGDVAIAQSIIGIESDGIYGPNTREAVQDFRDRIAEQKSVLEQRLSAISNDSRVQSAREEIQRIRARVETEVAQSNELINRLRGQLGTTTGEDIDAVIDEQSTRISTASGIIDTLTEEKFALESKFRQLEAEVGPIKYIAEFVYGEEADKNLLEEAVRWVIVIIIFVFDPLAVLLLIASQYTFRWSGRDLFKHSTYVNAPEDTPIVKNTPEYEDNTSEIIPEQPTAESDSDIEIQVDDLDDPNKDWELAQGVDLETDYDTVTLDDSAINQYDLTEPVQKTESEPEEHFYHVPEEQIYMGDESTTGTEQDRPHELSTGYVEYKDKRYTRDVFRQLYPEFQLESDDNIRETNAGFGTKFPSDPEKGDMFLRVDYLPTRLFKWNGQKWIPVDKEQTDQYAYHDAYIDHLIEKISTGEYDPEMLTDLERVQLEERLQSK